MKINKIIFLILINILILEIIYIYLNIEIKISKIEILMIISYLIYSLGIIILLFKNLKI